MTDSIVVIVENTVQDVNVSSTPTQAIVVEQPATQLITVEKGPKGDPGNGPLVAQDSRVNIETTELQTTIGVTIPPIITGTDVDPPDPTGLIPGTIYMQYI